MITSCLCNSLGLHQVPILLVQSLIFVSVTLLLLFLYPCNPNIVIIVPLHYYCQVGQDYIVTPWTPIYRRRFCHLYHPRIVHLCNVKVVTPSKWLIYKALISLFFYFWSWFHNIWYQSFGFYGFVAPNKPSWKYHYKSIYTTVQKMIIHNSSCYHEYVSDSLNWSALIFSEWELGTCQKQALNERVLNW